MNCGAISSVKAELTLQATFTVDPETGLDTNDGSPANPLATLQEAFDRCGPGDRIFLNDGTYVQDAKTKIDGTSAAPITVSGGRLAIWRGVGGISRTLEVNHSWYVFEGFTIDGLHDVLQPDISASYTDKGIYCVPPDVNDPVTYIGNITVRKVLFRNTGGEALRFRFCNTAEVDACEFHACGRFDYLFFEGGKNGEAVYIGTSPSQLGAPLPDEDLTTDIWVHDCFMSTQANEGVDIKEEATGCVIERNTITNQRDTEAGGISSRGDNNIIRDNIIYGCAGTGVRLGGAAANQGINHVVRDNLIFHNDHSALKIERGPQIKICSNTWFDILTGPDIRGAESSSYSATDT